MSPVIDRLVGWLKWPSALVALLLLPGTLFALAGLLKRILPEPLPMLPFAAGAAFYFLLWWFVLRHRILGTYLSTLEHELTHAIFAWATLHRVKGIRATWSKGGQVTFEGQGNWLITISPYFFPTSCVVLGAALVFVPPRYLAMVNGLLGATFVYHITATLRDTHSGQTDLQRVGWLFAFLFLPSANLLAVGAIVAFAFGGLSESAHFFTDAIQATAALFLPGGDS